MLLDTCFVVSNRELLRAERRQQQQGLWAGRAGVRVRGFRRASGQVLSKSACHQDCLRNFALMLDRQLD